MELFTSSCLPGPACLGRLSPRTWQGIACHRAAWICRAAVTSSSVSTNEERLAAAKDMTEWLKKQGFPDQPLSLSTFEDKGLGCCASRDLQADDLALSIPENYVITSADVASHPVVSKAAEGRADIIGLTLWMMYEQSRAMDSPWYPYLKVLPSTVSSPLLWETSEQELYLCGSPALDEVRSRFALLKAEFDSLKEVLQNNKEFPMENFTFDAFKTTVAIVFSRLVYLPSAELTALVPFGDLINHEYGRSCIDYDVEEQKVVLKVDKNYEKGEQVYTSYGPNQSNAELFIRYGFVDEKNEADFVEIEVDLVPGDPLLAAKREILEAHGLNVPHKFPLYQNGFEVKLLSYMRLSRIQDPALFAKVFFDKDVIINPLNEYEALTILQNDCNAKLEKYKSTPDEEVLTMRNWEAPYKRRLAARLRSAEMKILVNTVGALRIKLAPIRGVPVKEGGMKDSNAEIKEMFEEWEGAIKSFTRKFNMK